MTPGTDELLEPGQQTPILPPRRVKRWPRILLGVLIILVFAAGGVYWQISPGGKVKALAADRELSRGQIIRPVDLRTVELDEDEPIWYVKAENMRGVVGKIVTNQIGAGTIITPANYSSVIPLRSDEAIIGVAVDAGQYPIQPLLRGDLVNVIVFESAPQGTSTANTSTVVAREAEVFDVAEIGGQTRLLVSLRVEMRLTTAIAAAASQGRIWLVLVAG